MKTLIYQYYHAPPPNDDHYIKTEFSYWELSEQSIRAYANKIGSDYKFLSSGHKLCPFYGIFVPFLQGWCEDYDAICFVDSDMLATVNSESIWDHASQDELSAYFMATKGVCSAYPSLKYFHDKGHINSGTVVFPRAIYNDMKEYLKQLEEHHKLVVKGDKMIGALGKFDQAFINLFVNKHQKSKSLSQNFNYHLGRLTKDFRWKASLIHYHRAHKPLMKTDFNDERILK